MSLYSQYLRETGQRYIIENDWGFATYQITGQECYIVDIYIAPEHRNTGLASRLASMVTDAARAQGCKWLTGSVNTAIKDPTSSMKVLLAYGMKFLRCTEQIMFFGKEIT